MTRQRRVDRDSVRRVRIMMERAWADVCQAVSDRRGFVMPTVLFALVIMSTLAVAALLTADDERRSSMAMRESTDAFYAAEAGLHEVYATWPETQVDSLEPGQSLDLGWRTLDYGTGSYRAVIYRHDNKTSGDDGGREMYGLVVEGRGPGSRGAQRMLTLTLTAGSGGGGYMFGECCDATAILKGEYKGRERDGGELIVSGYDTHPPNWADAGVCLDTLNNKPGLLMADTSLADVGDGVVLEGEPPMAEDPNIVDGMFDDFGNFTWEELEDMADVVIDGTVDQQKLDQDDIYPRYNADGSCDTTHQYNWGTDDPDDPCFNHFPIILIKGENEFRNTDGGRTYGQGIFILHADEDSMTGAELELETNADFRGIILGKGCVEIQKGTQFYGTVFVDATYDGITCDKRDLHNDCYGDQGCVETRMQWSQCAVDRAIVNSGLGEYAEPTFGYTGPRILSSRGFGELLR